MKAFGSIICVLASGLVLVGCVTEPPVQKKTVDARIELVNNRNFSMELLSSATKIDDFGLLTVDANVILSRTTPMSWIWGGDPKVEVDYRFSWIDAQGKVKEASKHTIAALPGNIISIHGVAYSERDVSFKLTIFLDGQEAQVEPVKTDASKPAVKPDAVPAPKAEAKPAVKPEVKPVAPKAEAKPEVKPAPVAPKAEAKPEVKPEPVAPKAEAKPEVKPEPAAPKAEAKPEVKPEPVAPKAEAKPEVKPEAKPAVKPASAKLTEPFE